MTWMFVVNCKGETCIHCISACCIFGKVKFSVIKHLGTDTIQLHAYQSAQRECIQGPNLEVFMQKLDWQG